MSQKLCEKCYEWGESKSSYIRLWDHCHHEEGKESCDVCDRLESLPIEWFYSGDDPTYTSNIAKHCPGCGHRL